MRPFRIAVLFRHDVHRCCNWKRLSIYVDPQEHSLQRLARSHVDSVLEVQSRVENRGTGRLHIHASKAGCSCTIVSMGRTELEPGKSAILKAKIAIGVSSEPRSTTVVLGSNDRVQPEMPIVFSWQAVNSLETDPGTISLIGLRPGEVRATTVQVIGSGFAICQNCRLEGPKQRGGDRLRASLRKAGGLSANHAQTAPASLMPSGL